MRCFLPSSRLVLWIDLFVVRRVTNVTQCARRTGRSSLASTTLLVLICSSTWRALLYANSFFGLHFSSAAGWLIFFRNVVSIGTLSVPFALRILRRRTTSSSTVCSLGRSSTVCYRPAGLPSPPSPPPRGSSLQVWCPFTRACLPEYLHAGFDSLVLLVSW